MNKFIPPFRLGDVVRYIGTGRSWKHGQLHIIMSIQYNWDTWYSGEYKYSTNRGAWIDHKNFKLVEECSATSLKKIRTQMKKESGDELS